MTEEHLQALSPAIQKLREDIHDLHDALKYMDGREVKAKCADVAISIFKLGEAAEMFSEQKYLC